MKTLGNYFYYAYCDDEDFKETNLSIVKCVENNINNIDLISQGIYAVNAIVKRGF
jgi:hypothetical protein